MKGLAQVPVLSAPEMGYARYERKPFKEAATAPAGRGGKSPDGMPNRGASAQPTQELHCFVVRCFAHHFTSLCPGHQVP